MSGSRDIQSGVVADVLPPAWRSPRGRNRSNRKVKVQRTPLLVRVAGVVTGAVRLLGTLLRRLSLLAAVAALVAAVVLGGRWVVRLAVNSTHFAVQAMQINPTEHVSSEEVKALARVKEGEPLLAVDPDAIAARIAEHPWIESVKVSRKLPTTLAVEITERLVASAVNMGGLYLIDATGVPFKSAATEDLTGLVIITGIDRGQFLQQPHIVQAAFVEALSLLRTYEGNSARPALSEIHIDPRHGFSLFLREGGGEVRLGKSLFGEKLARLDEILEALQGAGPEAVSALTLLHLDDEKSRRISMRLHPTKR